LISMHSVRRGRHWRALAAGAAPLILAVTGAVAACSAPGLRPESSPGTPSTVAPPPLHAGRPVLTAAFTVPGGGLVDEVQLSPDGALAAAASTSATGASKIYVWDVATGRYLITLGAPGGSVYLAFGADDSTLSGLVEPAGSGRASIDRWDLATGVRTTLWSPPADANWIVSYNDTVLAIANAADDAIAVLSVGSGHALADISMPGGANIVDYGLELDADGRTLIASDQHGNSYIWDVVTGALIARLRYPAADVVKGVLQHPLFLSPDGKTVVIPDAQGPSTLLDVATGANLTPRSAMWPADNGGCLFSADSRVCATAQGAHTINLWDVGTGTFLTAVSNPALVGLEGIPAIGPDASEVVTLAPYAEGGTSTLYLWKIP
jgi:WD40 repeat protein